MLEQVDIPVGSPADPLTAEALIEQFRHGKRDFSNAILSHVQFRGVSLPSINLVNANLENAVFGPRSLGPDQVDPLSKVPSTHGTMPSNLEGANFQSARLKRTNFDSALLRGANFGYAYLRNAIFTGARMDEATFENADLEKSLLSQVVCRRASFKGAKLQGAILRKADLSGTDFSGADLRGADLTEANLSGATMRGCNLTDAVLVDSRLLGTKLITAKLINSNLRGVEVNHSTRLTRSEVSGCQIDRYTIESLYHNGGLSTQRQMRMNIIDDVARLRLSYSGFWQWIHLFALFAFLSPYVFFLCKLYFAAKLFCPPVEKCIPLVDVLSEYVYTGGRMNEKISWSALSIFVFTLAYNALRGCLLLKTKQLELQKESRGLPVRFSLTGAWGASFRIAQLLFYMNILLLLVHLHHFLKIPIYHPIGN